MHTITTKIMIIFKCTSIPIIYVHTYICFKISNYVYRTQENFSGGKIGKFDELWTIFAKSFLANIHRCTKNVLGICTLTVTYSPNFSPPTALPVWFAKISPATIFPCMVTYRISRWTLYLAFCSKNAVGRIINCQFWVLYVCRETYACSINGSIMA